MTVIFEADFEGGDFSEFDSVAASGLVEYRVQKGIFHSGSKAAKLTVYPLPGLPRPGVRLTWANKRGASPDASENLPRSATYSAWYYLPKPITTNSINIMQWKQAVVVKEDQQSSDPVWNVQLRTVDGVLRFRLRDRVDEAGQYDKVGLTGAVATQHVPIAQWFELKTLFEWDKTPNARVISWLNGDKLWELSGVQTEIDRPFVQYPRRVTWNNYAGDVRPWPYSLFVDDVRVEA